MNKISIFHCTMLALAALSSGCADKQVSVVNAEQMCRDWRHATVSKHDKLTDGTASQIEANNKSRPAWGCEYGKNEAAPEKG